MRTIRRRTREHSSVISGAFHVKRYALDNYFRGEDVPAHVLTRYCNGSDHLGRMGKLTETTRGYTLHVHDNLWFEFNSAPGAIHA